MCCSLMITVLKSISCYIWAFTLRTGQTKWASSKYQLMCERRHLKHKQVSDNRKKTMFKAKSRVVEGQDLLIVLLTCFTCWGKPNWCSQKGVDLIILIGRDTYKYKATSPFTFPEYFFPVWSIILVKNHNKQNMNHT